jgi:hypothetical protein
MTDHYSLVWARDKGGGEVVAARKGVGFPPLRASGNRTRESLRVKHGEPWLAYFL